MSQSEYYGTANRRGWWERLFSVLMTRAEGQMNYEIPPDSLFAGQWTGANSVADVPEQIKAQIREEALLTAFNRLESSLRLLLYATTPGKEPPTADRCHQILNVWRYELEHRVNLTPDTYCGAVQRYVADMADSYTIEGRCEPGDLLRIRVPCWRMNERVVIRGEAELITAAEMDMALAEMKQQDAAAARRAAEAAAAESGEAVPAEVTAPTAEDQAAADFAALREVAAAEESAEAAMDGAGDEAPAAEAETAREPAAV
jgi:hypothetical protein